VTGNRDTGSDRALSCDGKQCLVLRLGAETGVRERGREGDREGGGERARDREHCSDVWKRNSCGLIWCMVQRLERSFAMREGREENRGRRCTVVWVFSQILHACYIVLKASELILVCVG